MEPRQAISRSTLFSRRGFLQEDGGFGGGLGGPGAVPGRTTGSRYDRNRFAKLDLGNGSEMSSEAAAGRSGYASTYDRPALGLMEGLRLGLYDTPGRTSYLDGARGGPLLYESRRNGGGQDVAADERIQRIFGDIHSVPDLDYDDGSASNGHHYESEIEDAVREDNPGGGFAPDYEEEGGHGGGGGAVNLEARFQSNDVGNNNNNNKERVWKSFVAPTRAECISDNVIYYRLIDNYMIYQLETVDPSAAECGSGQSTVVAAPDSSMSSVLRKTSPLLEELTRCSSSGDVATVDGKLVLIKNMKILIEELQQKVATLQADVQDQNTASSLDNSKMIGRRELKGGDRGAFDSGEKPSPCGVSACNATSCRHLEELESLRRQNASLQAEKCQLEDQIVQLRSLKSIVHGTDSEKRAKKLELENLQLQNLIDRLRQTPQLPTASPEEEEDEVSNIKRGLIQTQQQQQRSTFDPEAALGRHLESTTATTTISDREARINDVMEKLKERHNLTNTNRSANTESLSRQLSNNNDNDNSDNKYKLSNGSYGDDNSTNNNIAPLSSSSSSSSSSFATTLLSSLDDGDGKTEWSAAAAAAIDELSQMMTGAKYDLDGHLRIINHEDDLAANGGRMENSKSDAKDGIRVVCRIRPPVKNGPGKKGDCILPPANSRTIQLLYRGRTKTFEVDDVFKSSDSQQQVFEEVRGHLGSCFDGNHVNFIAYGETGSGKSYTIQGTPDAPGLIHLVTANLLDAIRNGPKPNDCKLYISITEIHNETIRDLLNSDQNAKLDTRPNHDGAGGVGGVSVCGLSRVAVETEADVSRILKRGQEIRSIGSNRSNDHSSRSHLIVTVAVTDANADKCIGKVNFVDLAGSERIEKSSLSTADPNRFKEAQSVNKSLTCLGDVLHAILSKQTHRPFRSSKLTHVLQESLGGKGSSTVLICHLVGAENRASETMSTLMFAQRVRSVEPPPTVGGGGSKSLGEGGGSGSRTPVEPVSQRPRRPSTSGLSDRFALFSGTERRSSISAGSGGGGGGGGGEKRSGQLPPSSGSARRPTALQIAAGKTPVKRERSESRNEGQATTPGSRPRSSLKLLPPSTTSTPMMTTTTTTTPR